MLQVTMQVESCVNGFDEYMDLILDDIGEIKSKTVKKTTGEDHTKR